MGFIFFILCAGVSGGVTYHLTHIVLLSLVVGIIAGLTTSIIIVASE